MALDWLRGGGEMGERIRSFDWARTPLGRPEEWPQSLKTTVGIMLSTRHPVFIFWGPGLICLYNDAYAQSLGPEKHPATLGMRASEAWPEAYPVVSAELEQVMSGGAATWQVNALVPIHRYGRVEQVYWTYSYGPIADPDAANGVGGVLALITETTASVQARQHSEGRYQALFNAIDDGFCIIQMLFDADGRPVDYIFNEVNDAFERQTGLSGAVNKRITELAPQLESHWFEIYGRVALTGVAERFEQHAEALGRWFDVSAYRIEPPERQQVALLFRDVTERRHADASKKLLLDELNHRVKNTLASVQSLAQQTYRGTPAPDAFMASFESRLMSLSRSHDVLTRGAWQGAPLRELLMGALEPYGPSVELDGPDFMLSPNAGVSLNMAFHELATNAGKYGAFSAAGGRLSVNWRVADDGGEERLTIEWVESGGPPVRPPTRTGFGTRLIEQGIARELGGSALLRFDAEGLRCQLRFPVANLSAPA